MSIKVIEVSCVEDFLAALHLVEQESAAPHDAQHGDPQHDEETCPWCQLERLHIELQDSQAAHRHASALVWALLNKFGPTTLTGEELIPPRKMLSIDARSTAGGVVFSAGSSAIQ